MFDSLTLVGFWGVVLEGAQVPNNGIEAGCQRFGEEHQQRILIGCFQVKCPHSSFPEC